MQARARILEKLQQQADRGPDVQLLHDFEAEILSKTPHREDGRIANPTPLVDLTQAMKDCAREEYGLDLSDKNVTILGKLEAPLLGGSVKSRAAVQIVHEAIKSGRLKRGMVVFEVTSGNFGIALGLLGSLGIKVVVLVSRRLQEGVLGELEKSHVKTVDLDVDVCPAPGMQMDPNMLLAKVVATNMRERFAEIGLDTAAYDSARPKVEELLARQDVINLAKLFAEVYHGYCPEQYDNEDNVNAHRTVTGPELDQQLKQIGQSLGDFRIVCTFGTGGTSGGLSRYLKDTYDRKSVHVVFPPEGRDVAGIRTKSKASGLRFYEPQSYAGEYEVDFDQAKRLFGFLVRRGLDIGESSALALFAVLQMANFGMEGRFVVILADGAGKYMHAIEAQLEQEEKEEGLEVTAESAKAKPERFDVIIWTHMGYTPSQEGSELIAGLLGRPGASVKVASPADVVRLITKQDVPPGLMAILDGDKGGSLAGKRALLVCMAGNTSLRAAQVLESKGIRSQSLSGGMTRLAQLSHKPLPSLVRPAQQTQA